MALLPDVKQSKVVQVLTLLDYDARYRRGWGEETCFALNVRFGELKWAVFEIGDGLVCHRV